MTALMGLDARLKLAQLMLVVDAAADAAAFRALLEAAFAGGVELVVVRQGRVDEATWAARCEEARAVAFGAQGIVAVASSAPLAGRLKSDMLHLAAADGPAAAARKPLHQWALVGRSTHDVGQLEAAAADRDVHYLWVGPTFRRSATAPVPGLELVRAAARRLPVADVASKPWFAAGGIDEANLDDVLAAGARRIAVSTAIVQAADPHAAAASLSQRLRAAWKADASLADYRLRALRGGRPTLGFPTPGA